MCRWIQGWSLCFWMILPQIRAPISRVKCRTWKKTRSYWWPLNGYHPPERRGSVWDRRLVMRHFVRTVSEATAHWCKTNLCRVVPSLCTCSGDGSTWANNCSVELPMAWKPLNLSSNTEKCRWSSWVFQFSEGDPGTLDACIWLPCRFSGWHSPNGRRYNRQVH